MLVFLKMKERLERYRHFAHDFQSRISKVVITLPQQQFNDSNHVPIGRKKHDNTFVWREITGRKGNCKLETSDRRYMCCLLQYPINTGVNTPWGEMIRDISSFSVNILCLSCEWKYNFNWITISSLCELMTTLLSLIFRIILPMGWRKLDTIIWWKSQGVIVKIKASKR